MYISDSDIRKFLKLKTCMAQISNTNYITRVLKQPKMNVTVALEMEDDKKVYTT